MADGMQHEEREPVTDEPVPDLGRRRFVQAGSAGLVLGFVLPACDRGKDRPAPEVPPAEPMAMPGAGAPTDEAPAGPVVNGWLRIGPDDQVTLLVPEAEMGQGILTAFAMIAADELRADWSTMRAEHAPLDPARFGRQATGGSTSVRQGFAPLRKVAAQAREMLIAAAAEGWGVDPSECTAREGRVTHPAGERVARFGELAEAAAALTPPAEPTMLPRQDWTLIGTRRKRLDAPAKTRGEARFGLDVQLPGMRYAAVARSPIFGGRLDGFDAEAARRVPGVQEVVEIPAGVAVVAEHTWAALEGRKALAARWTPGRAGAFDTAEVETHFASIVDKGSRVRRDGRGAGGLRGAAGDRRIDADYAFPYLAHAPMEPPGCTAAVKDGGVELWVATQSPTGAGQAAARIAGVSEDRVTVHSTFLGGGFGRRSQTDFVEEAVAVAKALGDGAPVKLTWSREDEIQGGRYRPGGLARLSGVVGGDGLPETWVMRLATAPIRPGRGVDRAAVSGAADLPYGIPNVEVTYARPTLPITCWYWRSVGHSQNTWLVEGFLDELLALGGKDPVEGRLALLGDHPRHRRVLEVAAEKAGCGGALPAGHAQGVAVCEAYGSFIAEVAQVSLGPDGAVRVHRVTTALDCGDVINPDTVEAQIEGAVAFGLSAALHQRVDFEGGRAVQANFGDYPLLRMSEMPVVETHLVRSGEPLGGVGEPGTPPIAPAVANAVRALTGQPVRRLPIRLDPAASSA